MKYKITVFSSEIPYPPMHGGRLDIWNRLIMFKELGIKIQLICSILQCEQPEQYIVDQINKYVDDFIIIPRKNYFTYLLQVKYPARMLSFCSNMNTKNIALENIVKFSPNFILLDGWPHYLLAVWIKTKLGLPLIYRSHNVENEYIKFQSSLTYNYKKIILTQNAIALKKIEPLMRKSCEYVLDISEDDLYYWKLRNNFDKNKNMVLPYMFFPKEKTIDSELSYDIGFIGNLWAPNNVNGLFWFVNEVMPKIKAKYTNLLNIYFAGSNPNPKLIRLCKAANITVIENPSELNKFYSSTKVLVNPILYASGLNIKMIEMLYYGGSIVCTEQTTKGIPNELKRFCSISNNPSKFAEECVNNIINNSNPFLNLRERQFLINSVFGKRKFIEVFNKIIGIAK